MNGLQRGNMHTAAFMGLNAFTAFYWKSSRYPIQHNSHHASFFCNTTTCVASRLCFHLIRLSISSNIGPSLFLDPFTALCSLSVEALNMRLVLCLLPWNIWTYLTSCSYRGGIVRLATGFMTFSVLSLRSLTAR